MTELSSGDCFKIWSQFITRWPIEKLQNLTLEEYNSLGDKDSFCYWLESKTEDLGSMWGGSAFKFGIFEYNKQNDKETADTSFLKDDRYKWVKKYGATAIDAFNKIKEVVAKISRAKLLELAQTKLPDLNAYDVEAAIKIVKGTALNMGVEIK